MRKQMKIAAVVSTAALLALGASMTSMAAEKGTWKMDDNDWQCFDKNGDVYESTFCLSNGKEYYVGDDGYLVRSAWVDYDGDLYYVNSAGTKTINDWRLLTPFEDESADEEWYYFGSKGKRATSDKVVVKNNTYYFDSEGKMLTGWVDGANYDEATAYGKDVVYCDETGARASKEWVKTTEIGADEDDEDEFWYYIKSKGTAATGKQGNIKGQTYFFDTDAKMLHGWVKFDGTNYTSIEGENQTNSLSAEITKKTDAAYYCGDENDGHMKSNKWIKLWNNVDADDEDYDKDQYWFYLESDGKVFLPAASTDKVTVDKYELLDGKFSPKSAIDVVSATKKINGKTYYFDANGQMIKGLIYDETAANVRYLGDDGALKTGSQSIKDDNDEAYKFYFATKDDDIKGFKKGDGITGNKSGKLYNQGQLITADDYKYELAEVNGEYYIVNGSGSIQTNDTMYKDDGEDIIDANKLTFIKADGATKGAIDQIYVYDNDQKKDILKDFDYSTHSGILKNASAVVTVTVAVDK